MFRLRVLPTRNWQFSLRRHHSLCARKSPSPSPSLSLSPRSSSPLVVTSASQTRPSSTPLSIRPNAQFHSTPGEMSVDQQEKEKNKMGQTRGEYETGAETGAVRDTSEAWKSQPPYRTAAANEHFEKRWTAHCHCGRVKYWLSRERPLATKFCHCVDCQSLHGAPFQWAAIFEKEDLHFERGAEGLAFYHSQDKSTVHRLPCKVSCAYCHSPIMDEGRNKILMFPGIIKFKDAESKKLFDPQCHIFYSQRVVDIRDGKPKWSRLDGQSELIKDADRLDSSEHTVLGEARNEKIEN